MREGELESRFKRARSLLEKHRAASDTLAHHIAGHHPDIRVAQLGLLSLLDDAADPGEDDPREEGHVSLGRREGDGILVVLF